MLSFYPSVSRFTRYGCVGAGLRFGDDVRIRLLHTVDRMDLRNHDVGECPFIIDADKDENIRTAEAGVGLFDAGNAFERRHDVLGSPRFHLDENVRSGCHEILPLKMGNEMNVQWSLLCRLFRKSFRLRVSGLTFLNESLTRNMKLETFEAYRAPAPGIAFRW